MLTLKVESDAGDYLVNSGRDMLRIAKTLNVRVEAVWNGTTVWANPSDEGPWVIYDRFRKNQKIKGFNK